MIMTDLNARNKRDANKFMLQAFNLGNGVRGRGTTGTSSFGVLTDF